MKYLLLLLVLLTVSCKPAINNHLSVNDIQIQMEHYPPIQNVWSDSEEIEGNKYIVTDRVYILAATGDGIYYSVYVDDNQAYYYNDISRSPIQLKTYKYNHASLKDAVNWLQYQYDHRFDYAPSFKSLFDYD